MNKFTLTAMVGFMFLCLQNIYSQKLVSPSVRKDLEAAEARMFAGILSGDNDYCKKYLAGNYFSINADGSTQTKGELCADTTRGKFFAIFTNKLFDKRINVYGNVGIINGRAQAYTNGTLAVEYLYTAIFVKKNKTWLFTNWQGTLSKDSPKAPPMPQH